MTSFPGGFTGRINRPSLPMSNTFNGPPVSNPSRRHHHSGKTVWRFEVKVIVMVIIFIVMIYYLKMRFVKGFALILRVQFCDEATQRRWNFLSDWSMDMKQKSQNHAGAKQAARLEEQKHSVSTAGTHKNLADARIVFDGATITKPISFSGGFHRPRRTGISKGILRLWDTFAGLPSGRIFIWRSKRNERLFTP